MRVRCGCRNTMWVRFRSCSRALLLCTEIGEWQIEAAMHNSSRCAEDLKAEVGGRWCGRYGASLERRWLYGAGVVVVEIKYFASSSRADIIAY